MTPDNAKTESQGCSLGLERLGLVSETRSRRYTSHLQPCSELGHEDCLAANSRSTGPQQQNTDDHNTVQSIPRNDHLPLTGGLQVLTTDDVGCLCAIFRHVQQSCSISASVIMLTAQNRQLCPCLVQCVHCCYHGNSYFCFFDILSFNTIHIVGGTGTWQKHVFVIRV